MNTNLQVANGKHVMMVGLGSFIVFFVIEMVKSLGLGITFASSLIGSLTDALGRTLCIVVVFVVLNLIMNNNK